MQKEQQKPSSALKLSLQKSQERKTPLKDSLPVYPSTLIGSDIAGYQEMHNEYLQIRKARKKEFETKKREQFGTSSSEQDDIGDFESDSEGQRRQSNVQEQKLFKESQLSPKSRSEQSKLECAIYFSLKKGKEVWSKETLSFSEQSLTITDKQYFLKQVHKIKLIQGNLIENCNRIKLSCLDYSQFFIAADNQPFKQLPLNYYIFAFVIQQKLINMSQKLFKCQAPSFPGIPQALSKNSYNFGRIFKKSRVFGKWQERLVVINKEGVYCYKKFNEKPSMFIPGNSIKQIWTRFEIEEHLLVVKILHSGSKGQFGIPLTELLDQRCWLYSFYLLAFPQ